ncbi:hypothetical protein J7E29_06995 [Streptomyces sp. ISL-90]|nr:hypothetical protein [Streptomyces sp. ISL-90]
MRRLELRLLMQISTARRWPPRVVAILLLLAAALVVIGVTTEATQGHTEPGTTSEHGENNEGGEAHEESGTEVGLEGATLAGIPLESPLFIGGLAAASVVLAVAIWLWPGRATAALVIAFSIGAGIFDVAEIQHQAAEGNGALLAAAVVVVTLRILTIAGSVVIFRDRVGQLRAVEHHS